MTAVRDCRRDAFEGGTPGGTRRGHPGLNDRISGPVIQGGERGLLGIAFHPDFASTRRFYVHYTSKPDDATGELYITIYNDGALRRIAVQ
jgi:hypothetical protein